MVTIPEYVYNDSTIEFVCPSLELALEDAVQMLAVLTDPNWPDVLDEMEYICNALAASGFDSAIVSDALAEMYECGVLDDCQVEILPGSENREKRVRIANHIHCGGLRRHRERRQ